VNPSATLVLTALLLVSACTRSSAVPGGPPPEYEKPAVQPWASASSSAAANPSGKPTAEDDLGTNFDNIAVGDWVDETAPAPSSSARPAASSKP
jgi:hypothetical protein